MDTFLSRLRRAPLPHDLAASAEVAARFAALPPEGRALLQGTAGCSPFLKTLIERHADWLEGALVTPPEATLDAELAALAALPPDPAATATALRLAKARIALLAGLADLGGVWPLEQVTGALSAFADRAVEQALRCHLAAELRRGKVPGMDIDALETGAGMVVLAMGKMGAG